MASISSIASAENIGFSQEQPTSSKMSIVVIPFSRNCTPVGERPDARISFKVPNIGTPSIGLIQYAAGLGFDEGDVKARISLHLS